MGELHFMASKLNIRELTKDLYSPSTIRDLQCLGGFARCAQRRNKDCLILELGTLNGVSAMVMADSIRAPGKIITVDNYLGHTTRIGKKNVPTVLSYEEVCREIERRGFTDRIMPVKGDDIDWLKTCNDNSIDMFALDSLHRYDHVLETLEIVLPKMKDESIVCGHDYSPMGSGVVYAVEDWRSRHPQQLCGFAVESFTWWTMVRMER